jgi:hypothetical protein
VFCFSITNLSIKDTSAFDRSRAQPDRKPEKQLAVERRIDYGAEFADERHPEEPAIGKNRSHQISVSDGVPWSAYPILRSSDRFDPEVGRFFARF